MSHRWWWASWALFPGHVFGGLRAPGGVLQHHAAGQGQLSRFVQAPTAQRNDHKAPARRSAHVRRLSVT
jgi:hypothetical protein